MLIEYNKPFFSQKLAKSGIVLITFAIMSEFGEARQTFDAVWYPQHRQVLGLQETWGRDWRAHASENHIDFVENTKKLADTGWEYAVERFGEKWWVERVELLKGYPLIYGLSDMLPLIPSNEFYYSYGDCLHKFSPEQQQAYQNASDNIHLNKPSKLIRGCIDDTKCIYFYFNYNHVWMQPLIINVKEGSLADQVKCGPSFVQVYTPAALPPIDPRNLL